VGDFRRLDLLTWPVSKIAASASGSNEGTATDSCGGAVALDF